MWPLKIKLDHQNNDNNGFLSPPLVFEAPKVQGPQWISVFIWESTVGQPSYHCCQAQMVTPSPRIKECPACSKYMVIVRSYCYVLCVVTQLCPTLCDPMDCSPPGSSIHGDSLGNNTGVNCHSLLQGIFPTQGSKPDLPHCRQIVYCLSHQGLFFLLL